MGNDFFDTFFGKFALTVFFLLDFSYFLCYLFSMDVRMYARARVYFYKRKKLLYIRINKTQNINRKEKR